MQEATATQDSVNDAKVAAVGRAERIKQAASEKIQQGKERAKQAHEQAEDYVRAHPTKCVLGALGVGIAIGLIVRR